MTTEIMNEDSFFEQHVNQYKEYVELEKKYKMLLSKYVELLKKYNELKEKEEFPIIYNPLNTHINF